jgi:CBS domain-containing protein
VEVVSMKVRELMTTELACCTPETPVREAARLMERHDCGCVPVVEDDESRRLVGVLTDRDVVVRGVAHGVSPDTPVRELMSEDIVTCTPEDEIAAVERVMMERKVRRVPIVEDRGRCVGIVAQADLALDDQEVTDRELGRIVERISEPD